jgi:hypothetical protein
MTAEDPFSALIACGHRLDDDVACRIVALGLDAVPRLYELAQAEAPLCARVHAVRLLIHLRIESTFDTLIRIFLNSVGDQEKWEAFAEGAPALCTPFVDRVFALLEKEPEHKVSCAFLLFDFNSDPRIETLLDEVAELDPDEMAALLINSEDPDRLPLIMKSLENLVGKNGSYLSVLDMAEAAERLGAYLPDHVKVRVAQCWIAWELERRWTSHDEVDEVDPKEEHHQGDPLLN